MPKVASSGFGGNKMTAAWGAPQAPPAKPKTSIFSASQQKANAATKKAVSGIAANVSSTITLLTGKKK